MKTKLSVTLDESLIAFVDAESGSSRSAGFVPLGFLHHLAPGP
jgi:hypothetical protein